MSARRVGGTAERRMRERGEADDAIRAFALAYERYAAGESATISSAELEPAGAGVRALEELADADPAVALERLVQIKLNGGLATTMGLRSPKSLVVAREGLRFLDILIGQTLAPRASPRSAPAAAADGQRGHAGADARGAGRAARAREPRPARRTSCRA